MALIGSLSPWNEVRPQRVTSAAENTCSRLGTAFPAYSLQTYNSSHVTVHGLQLRSDVSVFVLVRITVASYLR